MKMKAYWHIHHNILLEFSDNIQERIDYIKAKKASEQIPTRLKLLKEVKGELPAEISEACAARDETWAAYHERAACEEAKAWVAYHKAWVANHQVLIKYANEIEALHTKECPGCPWNGHTIFPIG